MTRRARRRAFLRWLAATGLTLPALPALHAFADNHAAPTDLDVFLAALLQQLFPHPALDAAVYGQGGQILAGAADADPGLRGLIVAGWAALDAAGDGPWLDRSPGARRAVLEASVDTPFFQVVRGLGGLIFYSLPEVWALVGYQGPSFEKGGYLARGFDDIDWLPEPEHGD
ncbi:MAG: hypothetical protein JSV45_08875 [Chromatiales bacterium]|nr:MAG: hypothetical protein JSV45_08875 [Chromatiales bacterium]